MISALTHQNRWSQESRIWFPTNNVLSAAQQQASGAESRAQAGNQHWQGVQASQAETRPCTKLSRLRNSHHFQQQNAHEKPVHWSRLWTQRWQHLHLTLGSVGFTPDLGSWLQVPYKQAHGRQHAVPQRWGLYQSPGYWFHPQSAYGQHLSSKSVYMSILSLLLK